MRLDPAPLFRSLSDLLAEPQRSDPSFFSGIAATLRTLVHFDHVVVFGYRGDRRPLDLYDTFTPAERVIFVEKYQEGPYLLDPFFRAAREPKPGFWRMRELAPDRFFSSEYFRSYYVMTGLAEEVGYFVPLDGEAAAVLSLMRKEVTGSFPVRDVALCKAAEPLVSTLVRGHLKDLARRFDRDRPSRGPVGSARGPSPDSVWRDLNLTAREAAVVELVLQGHSSESIARRLEISTGTVKVHRRNVYRKLNIASQTQLLSIYLDRLAGRR